MEKPRELPEKHVEKPEMTQGQRNLLERFGAAPAKKPLSGDIKVADPNAVAGVRVAESMQKIMGAEDPVVVLLALGLMVGATAARQNPPDLANAMSIVHTIARSEMKRRRPGLKL